MRWSWLIWFYYWNIHLLWWIEVISLVALWNHRNSLLFTSLPIKMKYSNNHQSLWISKRFSALVEFKCLQRPPTEIPITLRTATWQPSHQVLYYTEPGINYYTFQVHSLPSLSGSTHEIHENSISELTARIFSKDPPFTSSTQISITTSSSCYYSIFYLNIQPYSRFYYSSPAPAPHNWFRFSNDVGFYTRHLPPPKSATYRSPVEYDDTRTFHSPPLSLSPPYY